MKKQFIKAKGIITRFTCLVLVAILAMGAITPLAANAASYFWPGDISASKYLAYVVPAKATVYTDATLSTPGSNGKAYNAYVDPGDEIHVHGFDMNNGTIVFDYPAGNTRRTAHGKISSFFGTSSPTLMLNTSNASAKTYSFIDGAMVETGSVYKGDRVWVCGKVNGGQYILIIYDAAAKDGRLLKASFLKASDLERLRGTGTSSTESTQTTSNQNMSYALYKSSGGYLSCGFDGYTTRSKSVSRHEGVDFVLEEGSAVYSLTDGVITRVKQGSNGSKGLSTIAIYSESANKTVIYLHTNPLDSLYVGQHISKGEQIGTEGWRGCSSSSGSHTHVELREGKQTHAAISIDDGGTLDNKNPKAFWESQGYKVK